jgi:hypothetical protein
MKNWKIILFFVPWILLLLALLLWSLGFNPWHKKAGKTEVVNTTLLLQRVEELGKMELVKYHYNEIFDYKALSSGKVSAESILGSYDFSPDLKVALIAQGEAVGCIDLRKLKESDIHEKNDTLYILLPEPEICYYKLDMDHTRIYDFERKGWWSRLFSDDDEMKGVIEKAYKTAEQQIMESAIKGGILDQTKTNAQIILKPMLEEISHKKIVLTELPGNTRITPIEK